MSMRSAWLMSCTSSALVGRMAGSLLIAFETMASTTGGMAGSIWRTGTGSSCRCLTAMLTGFSPVNGSLPVSIS